MSTSQNRREKRERERLLKLPPHKMLARVNKNLPKDMKVKLSDQQKEMSYEQWLNSVQITPEMLKELEQHDKDEKMKGALAIGAKNTGFDFEEVKY